MKKIAKFFLFLALIFLLIQPIGAEVLNQSSNQSGIQANFSTSISTNFTFNETSPNASQTPVVSISHSISSCQSVANSSSQTTVFLAAESLNSAGTSSNQKSQVTFITDPITHREYVSDQVIVRYNTKKFQNPEILKAHIYDQNAKIGAEIQRDYGEDGLSGMQVVKLTSNVSVKGAIQEYQKNPDVVYAQPNYVYHTTAVTPNDNSFNLLWGLRNTGQPVNGMTGRPGADINATAAWEISTGSNSVVVAVVDTGVLYTHSDLLANIWTNPEEIPGNGIDDDNNGYIDDVHGWNFITKTSDPIDDNGHGTHISGTIGAVGNNSLGVVGVNWHVTMMALKAFDATGTGDTSDAVSAILYANSKNASVIINAWNGPNIDPFLKEVIDLSPAVVVCAAGNSPEYSEINNDLNPQYPASFNSSNIISVAATNQNDSLASFSNYGPNSVDLAAPGKNIYSTYFDGNYVYSTGTSMATSYVAGVAALVKSVNPRLTNVQIKNIILNNVDIIPSLSGKVNTSGRLNAYKAVLAAQSSLVTPVANFTGSPRTGAAPLTVSFTDLSTNATGWNWTFGDGSAENATARSPVHSYLTKGNYTVSLNVTNTDGFNNTIRIGYINVTNVPDKIAVFKNGVWSLDYNGNYTWEGTPIDKMYGFGAIGDIPVVGDWNRNGHDKIGVFRSPGVWILDYNGNNSWDGTDADRMYGFGAIGDIPVVGDWNGDGKKEIGLFRSPGVWILDYNGNNAWDGTPTDKIYGFGAIGDIPVVGDWNGHGNDEIGLFRSPGVWILDYNGNFTWDGESTDKIYSFGATGDIPIVGDWNGDGTKKIGVYRSPGVFILDYNRNHVWDGPVYDRIILYTPNGGTEPVIGEWT